MQKKFSTIGIAAKTTQPIAHKLTRDLIDWIKDRGFSFLLDREIGTEIGLSKTNPELVVERNRLTTLCNPVVVLGGDGTLISVSRHPSKSSPIIVGVNIGTLGFLTEITVEELYPTLEKILVGKGNIEKRPLLKVKVVRHNKEVNQYLAINDVVITKQALARIFGLHLSVDKQFAALIRGDGAIVATPVGSTAYSMAAGGSIVHPQVDALLVTPICPHSLTSRPLVLPASSDINLKVASPLTSYNDEVHLTIDGQEGMQLHADDEVSVTTSEHSVFFAKSSSKSYFEILGTKLKWANH